MVFLRLTVKVYPREQVQSTSSFSIRSLLGDRDRDASSQGSGGGAAGKHASFLLVLENPEEVTLGGLAGMIKDKWEKLRPRFEPLDIKKLLDDEHDSDDLDADMTVADVFVDNGKAAREGSDQRATVRVIQKPASYAPVRFPSVCQDWDAATQDFERQIRIKKEAQASLLHKFPPIPEEPNQSSFSDRATSDGLNGSQRRLSDSAPADRRRDMPLSSVEHEEIPMSPPRWGPKSSAHEEDPQDVQERTVTAATSQHKRMPSQELGGSPVPSRTTTPNAPASASKPSAALRRGSANRLITKFVKEPDFPSPAQTDRVDRSESPTSPQQIRSSQPTQMEDEALVETEADESSQEEGSLGKENGIHDQDGDVAMDEGAVATTEGAVENGESTLKEKEKDTRNGDLPATSQRKRKKSLEDLDPNKQPRLEQAAQIEEKASDNDIAEAPNSSPSAIRQRDRAPSFSGTGRRPSLTGRSTELPKPGLGLGITKSPPSKKPVMLPLSQDSAKPGEEPSLSATPIFSSTIRRASLVENDNLIPTKIQTPALDKVKQLHSALRSKDSPAEKRSERRSVSFAEGEDIQITNSRPAPKSTPQTVAKGTNGTPVSSASGKKSSTPSKMVYPNNVAQERLDQIMKEASQKVEKTTLEKDEIEQKIKVAEEQQRDPEYVQKLQEMQKLWTSIANLERRNRQSEKARLQKFRTLLAEKQKEIEILEASMDRPSSQTQQIEKNNLDTPSRTEAPAESGSVKKTPKSQPASAKTTSSAKKPAQSNGLNGSAAKKAVGASSQPQSQSDTPRKAPSAATPTRAAKSRITATEPPQSSNGSDDVVLPPVEKIQRKTKINGTSAGLRGSSQEPLELSSSSEEETASEFSESSSESEDDAEEKPALSKADLLRRGSNPPSSQPTSQSPASYQSPPPRSWGNPINGSQNRATLKSLLVDKKKEQEAKAQQAKAKRTIAPASRKKDIFSGPSDSESEESESESDSDSDSDSSSAGDGDIMSSGTVGKLRPAVRRK